MNRTVGLAIGGAILAVTVGVMVGLVIHAGQVERAGLSAPGEGGAARSVNTVSSTQAWWTSTSSAPPAVTSSAAPDSGSTEGVIPGVAPTGTGASGNAAFDTGTTSAANPGAPAPGDAISSTETASQTAAAHPTTTTPGVDAAGTPCPSLAAKSSDTTGTTLFCQVDQVDRTLRWRAVVNKGGCLSQKMVGVAADGVTYRCTLDTSGQNHWAPAA